MWPKKGFDPIPQRSRFEWVKLIEAKIASRFEFENAPPSILHSFIDRKRKKATVLRAFVRPVEFVSIRFIGFDDEIRENE